MKKKHFKGVAALALVTAVVPTIVFASHEEPPIQDGSGEWDVLLNSEYGVYSSKWTTTRQVNSGGGDLRVCMSGVNAGNTITVNVLEYDPLNSNDAVKTLKFEGPSSGTSSKVCKPNIYVGGFVDGGSYAEIFLEMKGVNESDTVRVYIED